MVMRGIPDVSRPVPEDQIVRKHLAAAVTTILLAAGAQPAHAAVPDLVLLVNDLSGKCLTTSGRPDHRVVQAACDPTDDRQRWDSDGEHEDQRYVNVATGRCLTVFGPGTGRPVYAAACGLPGAANHWTWVWTADEESWQLQPVDIRGFCLRLGTGDGIVLSPCRFPDEPVQEWTFPDAGDQEAAGKM
jgi:hypothetical protein